MTETLLDGRVVLHPGNCLDVLAGLEPESIDSVVTDPPYHLTSIVQRFGKSNLERDESNLQLPSNIGGGGTVSPYQRVASGFMGQKWDGGAVAFDPATWALVHRLLKPGGHLLAMGGTRTYHRLACAIEDAGFEIRDTISWLYGSGFPKSHDVSKGIDRAAGQLGARGKGFNAAGEGGRSNGGDIFRSDHPDYSPYAPATDAARQWEGWGTALKPACELIVLARKPLSDGTVAANVLRWGTGAINVDGCRVATDESTERPSGVNGDIYGADNRQGMIRGGINGRWPANVAHDGSDEVTAAFPDALGMHDQKPKDTGKSSIFGIGQNHGVGYGDNGSAARFFYTAKADADDRLGSKHPTVKPLDLMQWLVRLVTPRGGVVLDPFAGTGTTGEAAWREGAHAVLVEAEAEYQADIRRRMALALAGPDERSRESVKAKGLPYDPGPLFGTPGMNGNGRQVYGKYADQAERDEWREMWAKPFDFSQEPKGNPG